jgi:hypothetical protein
MKIHAYHSVGGSLLFLYLANFQPAMPDFFNYLELPGTWNPPSTEAMSKTVLS